MFYITLGSVVLTIFSFMYFFLQLIKKYLFHEKINDFKLKLIVSSSCILLFWLLTYSLNAVYERIQNPTIKEGVEEYAGTLGDLVGGTLNPILGLFGIIVGGLAFYAQYQANKQIQEQFKIQQFETRLFKMLEIYNLHVSGLTHINRKTGKEYTGKNTFPAFIYDLKKLKKDIKNFNDALEFDLSKVVTKDYILTLNSYNSAIKIEDWIITELAYIIYFYGAGITGRPNIKYLFQNKYKKKYLYPLLNYLSHKPVFYKNFTEKLEENWKNILTFALAENFDKPNKELFDRYYNGNQNNLGHYYRHLFMISNFINDEAGMKYIDKWKYSKLLRTQMSNHEQELFFINSISVLGRDWEINKKNENKKLITKYDLLKNISRGVRKRYKVKKFYPNVEFEDTPGISNFRKFLEKEIYK